MKFYGFTKVTLIDYPEKIACTLFTHGCNLRCPYCHNPELVIQKPNEKNAIDEKIVLDFLKKRQDKLDGVAITGGEPLIHDKDLEAFIKKVIELGFPVKLDTNGTFPDTLSRFLKKNLLDYVAIDFKCSENKYPILGASEDDFANLLKSLDILQKSGVKYEIRITVVPGIHDIPEIKKIMRHIKGDNKLVLQNFIPNGTIDPKYKNVKSFPEEKLLEFKKIIQKDCENVEIRNI